MSTNRKPLEFKAAKTGKSPTKLQPREGRQKDFLFYLADGQSVEQACNLVGVTRAAYEKWRVRHEGFKEDVEAARESHRRDILCGFHLADAYARSLLDAIQRDESLPAPLRYRASKTILTRKGKKDWLPDPILAGAEPLAPYDDEEPESLTVDLGGNDAIASNKRTHPISAQSHPERTEGGPPSPPTTVNGILASPVQSQSEPESANRATESCCHGQSESSSAARGSDPSDLQAPKVAAEVPTSHPFPAATIHAEAGQSLPQNPDNPDKPDTAPAVDNSMKNQQDHPSDPIPVATSEFFDDPAIGLQAESAPHRQPQAAQSSEPKASAANSSPDPGPRIPDPGPSPLAPRTTDPASSPSLSEQWLSNTFLQEHESRKVFEKLLNNHIHAHEPSTPAEELLVFRITQKAWLLRRIETWERVITDSRVAKIRAKHPNAAAPACIAMTLLEINETDQTRFYERTAKLRKEHEDALDRLESKLFTSQQRREAIERRAELQAPSPVRVPENRRSFREPST